jgi:hypothetical protein
VGGGDSPASGSAAARRAVGKAGGLPGDEWARAFGIPSFYPAPPLTRSAIAANVSSRGLRTTQPLIDLVRPFLSPVHGVTEENKLLSQYWT